MRVFLIMLMESFPSQRNEKNLNKILNYNTSLTNLNYVIRLYEESDKESILSNCKRLQLILEEGVYSKFEFDSYRIRAIVNLMDLYPECRTEKYIKLLIQLNPIHLPSYKYVARFGIELNSLQNHYFKRAMDSLDDVQVLPYKDFEKLCGFELNENQIKKYLDFYFNNFKSRILTYEDVSLLLKSCYFARLDKRIVEEYIYLRTLKLDAMKTTPEIDNYSKHKNETIKSDNTINDLLLLGVAQQTINAVLNQTGDSNTELKFKGFGGGNFGGGGASSNY